MPMAQARRKCPHAVIVPPRFDRYQQVSAAIMSVFDDFSPEVEALSLDEAFLDMTGSERLFGKPEAIGHRLKAAICDATGGLTASVGISATKYVAKVASGYRKPDGLTVRRMPNPGSLILQCPDFGEPARRPKPACSIWVSIRSETWLAPIRNSSQRNSEVSAFISIVWRRGKIPDASLDEEHPRASGRNIPLRKMCVRRSTSDFTYVDRLTQSPGD